MHKYYFLHFISGQCQTILQDGDGECGFITFISHFANQPKQYEIFRIGCVPLMSHETQIVRQEISKHVLKQASLEKENQNHQKRFVTMLLRGIELDIEKQQTIDAETIKWFGKYSSGHSIVIKSERIPDAEAALSKDCQTLKEIEILKRLCTNNKCLVIPNLIAYHSQNPLFYLVEYSADSETLGQYIMNHREAFSRKSPQYLVERIMLPCAEAVSYMHEKELIHRNITMDAFTVYGPVHNFHVRLGIPNMAICGENVVAGKYFAFFDDFYLLERLKFTC